MKKFIKQSLRRAVSAVVSVIALTGILPSSTQANILPDESAIQQRINDVRHRLLESDNRIYQSEQFPESESNKPPIAQWYNFPNFPDWGNWGNFPNYWRNY